MPRTKDASATLPSAVTHRLELLGSNIRTARIRRRMPLRQLAERTRLTVPTLLKVEAGNPGTGIAAYATVLWVLGLDHALGELARPDADQVGLALEAAERPERARASTRLDDDF